METAPQPSSTSLPSIFEHFPRIATIPNHATRVRKVAFYGGLLAIPALVALGARLKSRRAGIIAGGIAALGLGALRWQLARLFADAPAYDTLGRIGPLELRHYPLRIEARTETDAIDLESAIDRGFGRLACYVYGTNFEEETLARTTPIVTAMRDGVYATSFVMPPRRAIGSLPHPQDMRIELREVPDRRIAVLPFRGRLTNANLAHHERRLLRALIDAGLVAKGGVAFACYDSPSTIPFLRRNELWIEIV